MPLSSDLREFIECLNSNEVEYPVVGALAVSWHGFPRYSADIDFPIRPSHTNAARVLRALSQFGFGSLASVLAPIPVSTALWMPSSRVPSRSLIPSGWPPSIGTLPGAQIWHTASTDRCTNVNRPVARVPIFRTLSTRRSAPIRSIEGRSPGCSQWNRGGPVRDSGRALAWRGLSRLTF